MIHLPRNRSSYRGSPAPRDRRGIALRRIVHTSASAVVFVMILVASFTSPPLAVDSAAARIAPTSATTSGGELRIFTVSGRRFGVLRPVHVLMFSGPQYRLQIALAHHAIDSGVATPSSMCRTTAGCVAAVNGDFFDLTHRGTPDPGDVVGGIIEGCVLLHTPEIAHQQADLLGQSVSEGLNWSSSVDVNGVSVAINAINQELPMSYLKVHLPLTGTLLFTAPYALKTPSTSGRVTYQFTQVNGSTSPTTINTSTQLELVTQTQQALRVAAGQVDISALVGSSFGTLQIGDIVTLTTTSTSGCDSIGGHPILLNHGVVTPIVSADTYMAKPYARSVIGWTASGESVIMTVDGKDGSSGATATQLVALLQSLGVVTALALDGGVSTTLYAKGRVLNRPSNGTERPVSTALLVVQN